MNLYEVLGVPPGADLPVIKAAHKAIMWGCHPDRSPADPTVAAKRCSAANAAYSVLRDAEQRRVYDAVHRISGCAVCAGKGYVLRQRGFTQKVQVPCPACKGSVK